MGHVRAMALIGSVLLLLSAAPASAVDAAAPGRAVRPVDGPVVRHFDPPATPYGPGHRGVDLGARPGAPVRAALPGVVAFAGRVAGRGWVTVDHGGGLDTTYGWLEPLEVLPGQRVGAGSVLGHLAPDAAHLDWGARRDGAYVDPLSLLGPWRARLVPVPAHARGPVRVAQAPAAPVPRPPPRTDRAGRRPQPGSGARGDERAGWGAMTTASPSALEREIREQPDAIRALLDAEHNRVAALAAAWRGRGDVGGVLLAARGSSDNAARYAQYLLGARNRLPVSLATPSLFTHYDAPPLLDWLLVGAISQSGRSPDVIGVVAEANRQGRPTFALTNAPDSPLAQEADSVIGLHAGEERSIAATKTYTTSLAALALLSNALEGGEDALGHLRAIPARVDEAVEAALEQVVVPDWLLEAPACAVIARGYNYSTAFETALKLKELTGIAAEPYSSADFLHGPVAAVSWQMPVVLLAPSGAVAADVLDLVGRLHGRGARVVVVADDPDALARADLGLRLPAEVPEWLSPLTAVVPGQVLAWRIALARGLDVDRPTGLRKITETH